MFANIFRIVVLGALVIAAGWAIAFLSQVGSDVPFVLFDKEYRPSLLGLALAIGAVLVLFYLAVKLVEFLVALSYYLTGDKNAIRRYFDQRSHQKGISALRQAVIATASGDDKTALKSAYRADRYLDEPAMTGLLIAEAAKRTGKPAEVEAAYKQVLGTADGRYAAIRGLMKGRIASGDQKTAIGLAKEALALNGKDVEITNTLYELQIRNHDFEGARQTLKSKIALEKLPAAVARRREAVLAMAEAQTLGQDAPQYKALVDQAFKIAPNLIPAALGSAAAAVAADDIPSAGKILAQAWAANPHPQIATAFGQLVEGEAPQDRLLRFKTFVNRNKGHVESAMLLAELYLAAEDYPAAKAALGSIASNPKTARQYAILAAIEHGMGSDEETIRAYLTQAARAPRGPEWQCQACDAIHAEWQGVCSQCERFDQIEWGEPKTHQAEDNLATPEYLLPLVTRKPAEIEAKA